MFEIYKSEFLRYRKWAMLATVALLAGYGFLAKLKPFLQANEAQTAVTYMILIGGALVFGFVQMMLHRRNNHWTYLIHRPLAPHQIYTGLALAGATVIGMVIVVPWLIMVGGIDAFSETVVDMRHYGYMLFLLLCCLTSYLVGTLTALNPSKGSILLAILLLLLMHPKPQNNFLQYAPMIVAIAVLFALNLISFKPDLSTYVKRPWAIVLMAIPMSYAMTYGLALSTTIYYHLPLLIMGNHPDDHPVDGSVSYLWSLDAPQQIAYALEGSTHPRANYYIKQAELADFGYIGAREWNDLPRRSQLHTLDAQYAITDPETNSIWQFSHDDMLLVGYSQTRKEPLGAIGMRGFIDSVSRAENADRFTEIPRLAGRGFLTTQNTIYRIDFKERRLDIKHQLPEGERYITRPEIGEHYVALVTNKRTLLFDPRVLQNDYDAFEPEYEVTHPVPTEGFAYIDTYRLVDGYLFLYRGNNLFGFDQPGTVVLHAKLGGENETIFERHFSKQKHPAWIRHYMEMVSPVLHIADNAYFSALEPHRWDYLTPGEILGRSYPKEIYWIAGILMAVSAFAAFLMCRRHRLDRAQTITWVLLCAILSLPALVAFFLMNPLRPEPHEA
ncbi:MAG: hypothetical protein HWE08_01735 [Alphaproteobacteria bacterium]|nr:hypothetical protein [Alphaproteobacteria bacterium]